MRYDAAIIGSGVSGLTAAIILAKEGRRVVVLEQASRPGGLMQSYVRGGRRHATGVHRLGGLAEGEILWRYFKYLGVLDQLHLVRMDPDGFEEYRFPGMTFRVPNGEESLRQRLIEHFPAEHLAVDRYLADMKACVKRFAFYDLDAPLEGLAAWSGGETLDRYLQRLTGCMELRSVLSACNTLYGIEPAECPLHVHWLVFDSFLRSAWRVDEDRTPLADAFVDALRRLGGETRCSAAVSRILCNDDGACGAQLADGERVEADLVVFSGHPRLLPGLCPEGALTPAYRNRLADLKDTPPAFGVALNWNHPDCPLAARDAHIYSSWNVWAQYDQRLLGSAEFPHMLFCSASPCACQGGFSVAALCTASPADWASWSGTSSGERPADYLAAKDELAGRVISEMAQHWPGLSLDHIVDVFSPLTVRDYTLAPGGCCYGVSKSVLAGKAAMLSARTRVRRLLLAGQSVILPGILGALISGVIAAMTVPGLEHLRDRIRKETA